MPTTQHIHMAWAAWKASDESDVRYIYLICGIYGLYPPLSYALGGDIVKEQNHNQWCGHIQCEWGLVQGDGLWHQHMDEWGNTPPCSCLHFCGTLYHVRGYESGESSAKVDSSQLNWYYRIKLMLIFCHEQCVTENSANTQSQNVPHWGTTVQNISKISLQPPVSTFCPGQRPAAI